MTGKLGGWCWYVGTDEDDEEMCECVSRAKAVEQGCREFAGERQFYIVEARMTVAHEIAMGAGHRDTAPFAETRNGEYICPKSGRRAPPL